ncbi:unnamed protein product [Macrosiphum euphorbiae]|uniref:Trehalase n=1 Tax=Macrosiphum euphorbiae TaxID=13131 RepID=A0AAV0WPF6_9HEMI|nr:unnamed protein product [Macrosiphum euphorbiae]
MQDDEHKIFYNIPRHSSSFKLLELEALWKMFQLLPRVTGINITKTQPLTTESEKENFYSEIKAAEVSGWDFSNRFFILNGTNEGNRLNLKTTSIVPVDLNSLVYWNANILRNFYQLVLGYSCHRQGRGI